MHSSSSWGWGWVERMTVSLKIETERSCCGFVTSSLDRSRLRQFIFRSFPLSHKVQARGDSVSIR